MTKSLDDRIHDLLADSDYPTLEDIEELLRDLQAENKRLLRGCDEYGRHVTKRDREIKRLREALGETKEFFDKLCGSSFRNSEHGDGGFVVYKKIVDALGDGDG